jgi:hypothetical protein
MAGAVAGEKVEVARDLGEVCQPFGFPRAVCVRATAFDDQGRQLVLGHDIFKVPDQPHYGLLIAPNGGELFAMLIA